MDNQTNVGNQNTQQVGQNPVSQPTNIQNNPRINYWMISTIVFGLLFFFMVGINFLGLNKTYDNNPLPYTTIPPTKPVGKDTFIGTVKSGSQFGEVKSHCPNGLYLVADEGSYLVDQKMMLQLRLPSQPDGTIMFPDQKYIDKKVEVVGKYPVQEIFCNALICLCEDYILVDSIYIIDTPSNQPDLDPRP